MNWTTEYPTQPGVYWIRNYLRRVAPEWEAYNEPRPGPHIIEIDDDLELCWPGNESNYDKSDFISAEWFGPIQPPQDKLREYEYREETLLGPQLAAEMDDNPVPRVPVMP